MKKSRAWYSKLGNFFIKPKSRLVVAAFLALIVWLTMPGSIDPVTRFLAAWDVSIATLLLLIAIMMMRAGPKETLFLAQHEELSNIAVLIVTITASMASLVAIALGLERSEAMSRDELRLHNFLCIIGVFCAWLLVHAFYALHYAKTYYKKVNPPSSRPFVNGLQFSGDRILVDYLDFVYFSFTIAMCYGTSDVNVTSPKMRRLTIFHAIISFFYVLIILGLMVNIISSFL